MAESENDPREASWELVNTEQAALLVRRQNQSLAWIENSAGAIAAFAVCGRRR